MADPHPVLVEALQRLALTEGLDMSVASARVHLMAVANAEGKRPLPPSGLLADRLATRVWLARRDLLVAAEVLRPDGTPIEGPSTRP